MVEGPVAVGVGLGEGGGVLPGNGGVVGDQALLHTLLLLHSAVLEPDLNLKPINQLINQSIIILYSRRSFWVILATNNKKG